MAFLGLEVGKAAPGYRIKRFSAFLIDGALILIILYIVYSITGIPDFPAVSKAMDAARAGAASPDAQALANVMFDRFNTAYLYTLLIGLAYEILTQLVFSGATLGKLVMRLKIMPVNDGRGWFVHHLLMVVRSVLKVAFLYIFQGLPFLISELTVFSNKESRSGFDMFVKTYVKDLRGG